MPVHDSGRLVTRTETAQTVTGLHFFFNVNAINIFGATSLHTRMFRITWHKFLDSGLKSIDHFKRLFIHIAKLPPRKVELMHHQQSTRAFISSHLHFNFYQINGGENIVLSPPAKFFFTITLNDLLVSNLFLYQFILCATTKLMFLS